MTEKDYINASNLARVRAAAIILREAVPLYEDEKEANDYKNCIASLRALEALLEKMVKVR